MTQDEIIEMANKAGIVHPQTVINTLEAFAKLVAQHTLSNIDPSKFMSYQEVFEAGCLAEREACAKLCESHWEKDGAALWCANAIRVRGARKPSGDS